VYGVIGGVALVIIVVFVIVVVLKMRGGVRSQDSEIPELDVDIAGGASRFATEQNPMKTDAGWGTISGAVTEIYETAGSADAIELQ
jgi:hypothetical protein